MGRPPGRCGGRTYGRDSSARCVIGAGPAPSSSFLPQLEGGSAGQAQTTGAPFGGAPPAGLFRQARPPALHTWRFLTRPPDFFHRTGGNYRSRYPGSIHAALHPTLSKPLKAAPSSGAASDLAPWDGITSPACRRHTLLCQLSVPSRHPQLSRACPV